MGSDAAETEAAVAKEEVEEGGALPEVIKDVEGRAARDENGTCRLAVGPAAAVTEGERGDPRLVLEVEDDDDWDRCWPSLTVPKVEEEEVRGLTEAEEERLWFVIGVGVVVVGVLGVVVPSPSPGCMEVLFCGEKRIFRVFHFFSRLPFFWTACGCDGAVVALCA